MDSNYYGPPILALEITRRGGTNMFGEPMYRLAVVGKITKKSGGKWDEYADHVPEEERGGIITNPETGLPMASTARPLRSVIEVREVPKYPDYDPDHLVLERWHHPYLYPPRAEWESPENYLPGGINILGPYPTRGGYEWCHGPFGKLPPADYVLALIDKWQHERERMDSDMARHVRKEMDKARAKHEAAREAVRLENAARIKEALSPLTSTTLQAGRWRNEAFERAGFRSHFGN